MALNTKWCTAQVGSLVPAESAELHVLDAVHTRMGASDNLAMGSSTFLEVSFHACQRFEKGSGVRDKPRHFQQ